MLRFIAEERYAGQRLDVTLAALTGETRSCVQRWVLSDLVRVNQQPCRPSQRLHVGDIVEASPPEVQPSQLIAEPIPLSILFEDPDLIVIDKPPGMVVHPAPGHYAGTLVHALLHHCEDLPGIGGVDRPGIVHRLDRGTSGLLVVAKSELAHHRLSAQFHSHDIERVYWALARGCPGKESGCIERAIGRHPTDRKRMSVRSRKGRRACTRWRVLQRFPRQGLSWLEVRPETGRTHQIRVHLSSVGLPLVGDPAYGRSKLLRKDLLTRPGLHAAVLGFTHPRTGQWMQFRAPIPEDLRTALRAIVREERT